MPWVVFNWPRPRKQSSAGGECVFRVWPDKGIIESCSFRTTKMEDTAPTHAVEDVPMIHSIAWLKYQWYTGYHRIMFCLICNGFLSTCFQDQFPGGLRSGYSHTTPNLPSTRWTFHVDASESLVVNQISLIVCPITFHKFHTSQVVFFRFLLNNSTNITSILKNKLKWFTFNLPLPSYFQCTLGLASMLPPKLGSRNSGCQRLRRAEGCSGTPGKLTTAALERSGVAVEEAAWEDAVEMAMKSEFFFEGQHFSLEKAEGVLGWLVFPTSVDIPRRIFWDLQLCMSSRLRLYSQLPKHCQHGRGLNYIRLNSTGVGAWGSRFLLLGKYHVVQLKNCRRLGKIVLKPLKYTCISKRYTTNASYIYIAYSVASLSYSLNNIIRILSNIDRSMR